MLSAETDTRDARTFLMLLFPPYMVERVESLLDEVGVPGYSHTPDVLGRGTHGRRQNNPVWPGATGEIFTVVDDGCAHRLLQALTAFNAVIEAESHGLYGVHVVTWPCEVLL